MFSFGVKAYDVFSFSSLMCSQMPIYFILVLHNGSHFFSAAFHLLGSNDGALNIGNGKSRHYYLRGKI